MKMVNCLAAGGETVTIVPSFSNLGGLGERREIDGAITSGAIVGHGACPYIPTSKMLNTCQRRCISRPMKFTPVTCKKTQIGQLLLM